ncbi:MAG: hypothetical protein QOK15_1802 [Nocardioidaceae bacterium]|jgi:outer membrane protein assembly factor BamB|nr:hypothetical protein [Nocardioidaceae bacterium]
MRLPSWATVAAIAAATTLTALTALATLTTAPADSVQPGGDWAAYLHGPQHTSYAPGETRITPANVGNLKQRWRFRPDLPTAADQPDPYLYASPAVADGVVYVGSNNGYFYKLSLTTGAVLAKRFLGYQPPLTCHQQGVVSSATVAPDPADGRDTVYIASPDGYLYALRPGDLSTKWRSLVDPPSATVNDYFNWSSPTVANGHIYLGSASNCDDPLTRGAIVSYDQATGRELARYYTVPQGLVGGGVWTSVAVASDGTVYSTTGTEVPNSPDPYESVSIVHLDATLKRLGVYTIPKTEIRFDSDFGASPVLFGGLVGACNKNGIFYAIDRTSMTLRWKRVIGAPAGGGIQCSASAAYDGSYLYVAGTPTTIGGTAFRGSIRRLDPATGKVLWARGLPNSSMETPTVDGAGVLTVGTWDKTSTPNAAYLLDASTGKILRTLNTGGRSFSPSIFADGWLLTTNVTDGLRAYHLPSTP